MATRGFEFAYSLDGSTPMIVDLILGEDTAYNIGDAVLVQSDGFADKVTGSTTEVTGIVQEAVASPTAGTTTAKVALVTASQVWRCSMDATTTTGVKMYSKLMDTADCNTIDADDVANGRMLLVDTGTDDDGNVLGYVIFTVPTCGNALS